MSPARIGVGLLGCGFIAATHVRSLLEFADEIRIVALCDRSGKCTCDTLDTTRAYAAEEAARLARLLDTLGDGPERDRLAARHAALLETASQEIRVYTSRGALAGDPDVDLVVNSTPPFVHYRSTLDLLQAGKHVLLEKPFTGSLRHADELIAAAERRGLCLSVVSQGRFADEQRRMRELVRQDKLGRTFLLKADTHWWRRDDYYRVWWRGNWANECGGVLLNHAWHLLDQGLYIMGRPVARVSAQMGAFVHDALVEKIAGGRPIDDTIVALLTFADGSLGEVTAAVSLHVQRVQLEVYGSRAATLLNPWQLDSQDPAYAAELRDWAATCIEPMPEAWRPSQAAAGQYMDPTWPHTPQVRDVLDAIRDRRPPLISGREARATLEVVLAAYKSALTGQPVDLPLAQDDPYYDGVLAALDPSAAPLPVD
jgi:UDP-N-acetyl-2-amino-2-deoxyglucuronate dehydrogenase